MGSKRKSKNDFREFENIQEDAVTDSDAEYSEGEKELLRKVRKRPVRENFDSDDEVYGIQSDQDEDQDAQDQDEDPHDEDSMESDLEDTPGDDLPDERAWGKRKKTYFMTDYVDQDYSGTNEKDMAAAELEEKEARNIQQRLAQQLDDADFGLDAVEMTQSEEQAEDEDIVKTDLSQLSKREKLALLKKESPEFQALVDDFQERMAEAKDILSPFLKLAEVENLPECRAIDFIRTKYGLILNYSVNIHFYLVLKAKKTPIVHHPVIKRLAQYRQLIGQLEEGQGELLEEVSGILEAKRTGQAVYSL